MDKEGYIKKPNKLGLINPQQLYKEGYTHSEIKKIRNVKGSHVNKRPPLMIIYLKTLDKFVWAWNGNRIGEWREKRRR